MKKKPQPSTSYCFFFFELLWFLPRVLNSWCNCVWKSLLKKHCYCQARRNENQCRRQIVGIHCRSSVWQMDECKLCLRPCIGNKKLGYGFFPRGLSTNLSFIRECLCFERDSRVFIFKSIIQARVYVTHSVVWRQIVYTRVYWLLCFHLIRAKKF